MSSAMRACISYGSDNRGHDHAYVIVTCNRSAFKPAITHMQSKHTCAHMDREMDKLYAMHPCSCLVLQDRDDKPEADYNKQYCTGVPIDISTVLYQ